MSSRFGKCHICGFHGPLSFEHVPPQAAFNSNRLFVSRLDHHLGSGRHIDDFGTGRKKQYQRGLGEYSLCGKCNSDTGAWYGNAYIDWATQAFRYSRYARHAPSLVFPHRIFPLLVFKQIICMFMSINGEEFSRANPLLAPFVLSRARREFPSDLRLYTHYSGDTTIRHSGVTVSMHLNKSNPIAMSEILFPPLGYVLTFGSEDPPDPRLLDITFFHKYSHRDMEDLSLPIQVLSANAWVPGSYQ